MCETNYSIQKKKYKNTYNHNEQNSQIFIFEVIINIDNILRPVIIRYIKKSNPGSLFLSEKLLNYNNIKNITINVMNPNNINYQINADITLDQSSTYTSYVNSHIYLEFTQNVNGYLECNYNIL